jgi:ribosomal protein S27E
MNDRTLDGNVLGGPLDDVFAFEFTTAQCTCEGCGAVRVVGALHVYADAPGMVVRCPDCDHVVLRFVRDDTKRVWLDMRGTRVLQIRSAE